MDTQKLRQRILDLAIRGKLVPQDPNDEPASVLLERIRAEKERLIAEGKIKRPKAKKSTDKSHYQNFTPPFPIPASWQWVRLEDISYAVLGKMLDKSKNKGVNHPYLRNINVRWFEFDVSDLLEMPFEMQEADRYSIKHGDLVICEGGEPGRCAVWDKTEPIMFQKALHRVRFFGEINSHFISNVIYLYCLNGFITTFFTGSGIKHLTGESLANIPIPMPPIKEQQRILKSVNSFDIIIQQITDDKKLLSNTIILIKSKILDLAMQGKLVPQDPADEPAADMLRRVNPKAKIITDNPHYTQLPDNWVYLSLSDINTYKSSTVTPANMPEQLFDLYSVPIFSTLTPENIHGGEIGSAKQVINKGDVLLCKINPHLNRVWEIIEDSHNVQIASSEWIVVRSELHHPSFLKWYFNSPEFRALLSSQVSGVGGSLTRAQPAIVKGYLVPVPPMEEQARISKAIEHWFECLDSIISGLSN